MKKKEVEEGPRKEVVSEENKYWDGLILPKTPTEVNVGPLEKRIPPEEYSAIPAVSKPVDLQLTQLESYIKSGLLPASVKTLEAALVIIQYGRELGFGEMQSFSSIYVVKGRPSLSTAAMSALLRKAGIKWKTIQDYTKISDQDGKLKDIETTIRFYRDGIEEDVTFTMQDANTAGLISGSDVWKKYPKIMLYWRAFSIGARRIASDCIMGLYTTEEAAEIEKIQYDLNPETGDITLKQ